MKIDPEDARWTAYVLGELDLDERRQLDEILETSDEARRLVSDIEETVTDLADHSHADPQFRLTSAQMAALFPETAEAPTAPVAEPFAEESPKVVSVWDGGQLKAMAAAFVVLGAVAVMLLPYLLHEKPEMGSNDVDSGLASVAAPVPNGPSESTEPPGFSVFPGDILPGATLAGSADEMGTETEADRLFQRLGAGRHGGQSVFSQPFVNVSDYPVTACSLQVGGESYYRVREAVWREELPTTDTVRVDELVNHFNYDYADTADGAPLALHLEAATCPWNARHRLIRVGLKGRGEARSQDAPVNIVLLIDGIEVRRPDFDRAAFLQVLTTLRGQMQATDQLAVIDGSRLVGPVIRVQETDPTVKILDAITSLTAGGSVDIGVSNQWLLSKILPELRQRIRNEVVLVSGGTDPSRTQERLRLLGLLDDVRPADLACSILDLGNGAPTLSDAQLASAPEHVRYRAIRSLTQADRFWADMLNSQAPRVANDVRLRVEFNPRFVQAYRMVGQRPAALDGTPQMLIDDELFPFAAGQELTALYEVVPVGLPSRRGAGPASVQGASNAPSAMISGQLLTVNLDYRLLESDRRVRRAYPLVDAGVSLPSASGDFKFSASVAAYGMLISGTPFTGTINHYGVLELAQQGLGDDSKGQRKEFLELVKRTLELVLQRNSRVRG